MKKILIICLLLFIWYDLASARAQVINWAGLPGWSSKSWWENIVITKVLPNFIATLIKYVAVVAVISTMLSWIIYLTSAWKEDTVKKAKSWIIYSLAWVLLSVSAWFIINLVNTVSIPNS